MHFGYGNVLETETVTITSEATGYPGYRLYDKDVSLPWKATSAVSQTIKVCAVPGNTNIIDRMILTGHNLSCVTSLKLDWSDNDSDWTNILTLNPSNNDTINSSFSASTHRCFRVVIDTPSKIPEISELYLGNSVEIVGYPVERVQESPTYIRTRRETQSGIPWIIEEGPAKGSFICAFNGLTSAQKDYILAADSEGFFFFINHNDVLHYVESKTKPNVVRVAADWFDVSVDFLEVDQL